MTKTLDVYLFHHLVGRLEQQETGQLGFIYDPTWLATPDARPLSQSLPLRESSFDHRACRPFFAGLLPEAEQRQRVARVLGVTPRNDFALLDRIGGECAGAITFVAAGASPPAAGATTEHHRILGEEDLATVLRTLPQRPLLAGEKGLRLSLAGAQDKLPVLLVDDEIALPLDDSPSSHILKPQIRDFENTVENEAFCLHLAGRVGLHVVQAEIRSAQGMSFLLVTRYDRVRDRDGTLRRLHQEDFCQALGIPPENKYESEGGPSLGRCFALVRRAVARPVVDLARLLDFVVFNVVVGNHDAHGKNYSLLYGDRRIEMAPLYDSLSTTVYPALSPRFAMKIGGRDEIGDVMPRHWDRFAKDAGLAPALLRRRVVELATAIEAMIPDAGDDLVSVGCARTVVDPVAHEVHRRAALLRQSFEHERP